MEKRQVPILGRIIKNDAQGMLLAVALLIGIGCINIFSATFVADGMNGGSMGSHFYQHLVALALSLFIGLFVYKQDFRVFKKPSVYMMMAALIFLSLVAVLGVGTVVNGARRWIIIMGKSVQPSEFAKLGAILWAAAMASARLEKRKKITLIEGLRIGDSIYPFFTPIILIPGLYALLTMLQPDMGTAVLILAFALLILVLSGVDGRAIKLGTLILAVAGTALVALSPYRRDRIVSLYDPWQHARDLGYQTIQGLMAVGSGGIFGQGFGKGTSKYFYLPEAHTDFAFAVWAQETGLVGSLFVVALVLMFTFYGVRIAFGSRDFFGRLTAIGITTLISGQAIFNMLMVCGLLPVTGVPLPFISFGGSSLLMNCVAIAILASIARHNVVGRKPIGVKGDVPSLREETQSRFEPRRMRPR